MTGLFIAITAGFLCHGPVYSACLSFDEKVRSIQFQGDYQQAHCMLQARLDFLERQTPRKTRQVIKVLNQMTENATVLNRNDLAITYATRVYELLGTVPTASSFDRISQLHKLALLHELQGDLVSAEERYSLELSATSAILSRANPATMLPKISLARVLESQYRYPEAQVLQAESLCQVEAIFGIKHIARSTELIALGRLAYKNGQDVLSEQYYMAARQNLSADPVINASQILEVDRALQILEGRRALAATKVILPN